MIIYKKLFIYTNVSKYSDYMVKQQMSYKITGNRSLNDACCYNFNGYFSFFVPVSKVEYRDIKMKKNVAPTTFFRKTQPGRKKSNMAIL